MGIQTLINNIETGGAGTYANLEAGVTANAMLGHYTRAQLAAMNINANVDCVVSSGYATTGDGGHARYVRGSEPDHAGYFTSADGAFWVMVPEAWGISGKAFGATGDGVTDDWAALQNMLDAGNDYFKCKTNFGAGTFVTSDTLSCAYGVTLRSCHLTGAGRAYRGESGFVGTTIKPTFVDRPVIAVQGLRSGYFADFTILGALDMTGLTGDPTTAAMASATWEALDDGAGNTVSAGRYNPYAGIAIDPYSGVAPTPSSAAYPNVTFPAYMSSPAQYGKLQSSNITLERLGILHVNTGVVVQPSNTDSNGDFTKLLNCSIERAQYALSVGNTQSRSVTVQGLSGARVWCVFTNNAHGKQQGKFGGMISDVSYGGFVAYFLRFGDAVNVGAPAFHNCDIESLWKIANLGASSSNDIEINLYNCELTLSAQTAAVGVPAYSVEGTPNSRIRFHGGIVNGYPAALAIETRKISVEGTHFDSADYGSTVSSGYEAAYANHSVNGLVVFPVRKNQINARGNFFNIDTNASLGLVEAYSGIMEETGRTYCIPRFVDKFRNSADLIGPETALSGLDYVERQRDTDFSAFTRSGRTLTITWASTQNAASMVLFGYQPGCYFLDEVSGTVALITAFDGTNMTAVLQNNYVNDGAGSYDLVDSFSLTTGGLIFFNSYIFAPSVYTTFEATAASATITVNDSNGNPSHLSSDLATTDYIWTEGLPFSFTQDGDAKFSTILATSTTCTMAGAADGTTAEPYPLLCVRTAP